MVYKKALIGGGHVHIVIHWAVEKFFLIQSDQYYTITFEQRIFRKIGKI